MWSVVSSSAHVERGELLGVDGDRAWAPRVDHGDVGDAEVLEPRHGGGRDGHAGAGGEAAVRDAQVLQGREAEPGEGVPPERQPRLEHERRRASISPGAKLSRHV
jgi:hypothetical protein